MKNNHSSENHPSREYLENALLSLEERLHHIEADKHGILAAIHEVEASLTHLLRHERADREEADETEKQGDKEADGLIEAAARAKARADHPAGKGRPTGPQQSFGTQDLLSFLLTGKLPQDTSKDAQ